MNKKILMIALDFPPCKSAGVQRTLKFAEYLSDHGWEPIILTVNAKAHEHVDDSQLIPSNIKHVYRSFSFNAARDFSIKGKYLSIMKEPDKWWTWQLTAISKGKEIIKEHQPALIWSTYPIASAHNIAYKLERWSGLPWIADFRDPVQSRYDKSADRFMNLAHVIERRTITSADKVVFTTSKAALLYQYLYPKEKIAKFSVIENGYDEGNFNAIPTPEISNNGKFTLLHSGAIYENGRDPSLLLKAIATLNADGILTDDKFELVFRGTSGDKYQSLIDELNINNVVSFKPSIDYMDSLKEMLEADGLLIIQSELFDNQVPGKVFEYIRSEKPILAFTSKNGATHEVLTRVENSFSANSLDDLVCAIKAVILAKPKARANCIEFSRSHKTQELSELINNMIGE